MKPFKILILAMLLALPHCTAYAQPAPTPKPDPLDAAKAAVGMLYAHDQDGTRLGSCVVVDKHFVLTATHVVGTATLDHITCTVQGMTFNPSLIVRSQKSDITAVVAPATVTLSPVDPVSSDALPLGTEVTAVGYHGIDAAFTVLKGSLLSNSLSEFLHRKRGDLEHLVISQDVQSGMSGGGAFTRDGKLIGIIVSKLISSGPNAKNYGVVMPYQQPPKQ